MNAPPHTHCGRNTRSRSTRGKSRWDEAGAVHALTLLRYGVYQAACGRLVWLDDGELNPNVWSVADGGPVTCKDCLAKGAVQ